MYESGSDAAGCDSAEFGPAVRNPDAHGGSAARQGSVVERLSRYGMQVLPGALQRRSRLQRQQEVTDGPGAGRPSPERSSLTPAMRKKYFKELTLSSSVLSSEEDADWAALQMEHAWMLSAVDGSYETILDFISRDRNALTRRDFISGYSVLHWLAKSGQDETLIKLLRHAERERVPVNVNLRGSGGLTPLHVATMHGRYMVIKLLVGAFGADVDVMDYNGRRAWQYLRGDAPLEMKELLGAWDEEHRCGWAQNVNNNSSASGAATSTPCDEVDAAQPDEADFFDRTKRGGSWRLGSIKKLLPSLSFLGNKR